jgi:MFS family permease
VTTNGEDDVSSARTGISDRPGAAHRDLRLFLGASGAGLAGAGVGRTAIPLLAVTSLGASPFEVGLLTTAQTMAFVLIGLPAGAIVDRVRRLPLMVAMDVIRCGLAAGIVLLWASGALGMTPLIAISALTGCATVFFDVAAMAHLPSLTGPDRLRGANKNLQGIASASSVAAPALAGGLAAVVGAAPTTALTAVGYAVSGLVLHRIRPRGPVRAEPAPWRGIWSSTWEGLRHVWGTPTLRVIALCTASVNLALAVRMAVLVIFLVELGFGSVEIGIAMAATGTGGVLAMFSLNRTPRHEPMAGIWRPLLCTQAFALLVPLAATVGPALVLVCVGMAATGYGATRYNVAQLTFRQRHCPPALLGRVSASNRFLVWSVLPVGGLLGGALGSILPVTAVLWIVAAGQLASVGWLIRFPHGRGVGEQP